MTVVQEDRRMAVPTAGTHAWFGRGLLMLAALLVLNTVLGPLALGTIDYSLSDSLYSQLLGLEIVTMLLVVPWMVAAGVLALRGHVGAPILGFGPSAYTAYMFVQYVVGPEYDSYGLTPLFHVLIVALSGALLLTAWGLATDSALPAAPHRMRSRAVVLGGLGAFVVLRYVGTVVGAFRGEALPREFADSVTFYWSIVLLDLGVVVPATAAAAIALWRGSPAGHRGFYATLGWFALVPPSVAAMALVMALRDDAHASWPNVVLMTSAALVFGGYAATSYRRLLASGRPTRTSALPLPHPEEPLP